MLKVKWLLATETFYHTKIFIPGGWTFGRDKRSARALACKIKAASNDDDRRWIDGTGGAIFESSRKTLRLELSMYQPLW